MTNNRYILASLKIKKFYFLIVLLMITIISLPIVFSRDIILSVNQSDYYFTTGENAIVPLDVENTYDNQIDGSLRYTINQEINQGNFRYSNSNTQSIPFSAIKGRTTVPLNFGSSQNPVILRVQLGFSYNENEPREANLGEIVINFVSSESEKKNEQDKVQSQSQKVGEQNSNPPDPFAKQGEDIQKMIDQFFGNNQKQQENPQDRVQNNQLNQDSSALKKQMEKQMQDQQKMKEEFQKQIANNPEFQKMHNDLINQGYNVTGGNLNPTTNNTGNFELNYQNKEGEQVKVKGDMLDGKMQNLKKQKVQDKEYIIEKLNQDKDFQKYNDYLKKNGFNKTNIEFNDEENKTSIQVNYQSIENEKAKINAEFINDTIKNVMLEKEDSYLFIWPIIIFIILLTVSYIIYKRLKRKDIGEGKKINEGIYFDYHNEANRLLKEAETDFNGQHYKDAYGKAGQGLRLFLSYENNLKKELTNDDIIRVLIERKKSHKEIKECFDLCSLVEFAKYEANTKDFEKILKLADKVINKR